MLNHWFFWKNSVIIYRFRDIHGIFVDSYYFAERPWSSQMPQYMQPFDNIYEMRSQDFRSEISILFRILCSRLSSWKGNTYWKLFRNIYAKPKLSLFRNIDLLTLWTLLSNVASSTNTIVNIALTVAKILNFCTYVKYKYYWMQLFEFNFKFWYQN